MADRRGGSVRLRTTAAAVLVVGVTLVAGGVALVVLLRDRLADDVRATAFLRAGDVAAALGSGTPAGELTGGGFDDDLLVQIVDGDGRVIAASPSIAGRPRLADLAPGRSARIDVPVDDDRFLAVAAGATTSGRRVTVLVARTLDTVDESTQVVTRLLLAGIPVLLSVVALTAWRLAGRALVPVDAMTREVDTIGSSALHRRVPVPPSGDEVARLGATMNRMLDRLERAQDEQRRFVSDASHELRSPIASVRQQVEVALAHPGRTTVEDLAGGVLDETVRMQRLVDDLLLLARADEGMLDLRRQPVDVDDIVFDEARRLRETTSLRVDTRAVSAGRVVGDGSALRRVVRNVADNASRHARSGVAFALTDDGRRVVLRVEDDGAGIPASDRRRVLERFVRLDDGSRSRDGGGAGLGLAIVAEIVASHGGDVRIDESPLGGARVELAFSRPSASD